MDPGSPGLTHEYYCETPDDSSPPRSRGMIEPSTRAAARAATAPMPYMPLGPRALTANPANTNPMAFANKPAPLTAARTRPRTASGVRRWMIPCAATSPIVSLADARSVPPSTNANHGAKLTAAKPTAIAEVPPTSATGSARTTTREASNAPRRAPPPQKASMSPYPNAPSPNLWANGTSATSVMSIAKKRTVEATAIRRTTELRRSCLKPAVMPVST